MLDGKTFDGLKVLDLSQGVAAPHCAMMLAQHGASVTKVEPHDGDWSRIIGKRYDDFTAATLIFNRGKQGLALDLKSPAGFAITKKLAADADIILQSFRPGVIRATWARLSDCKIVQPQRYLSFFEWVWGRRPLCGIARNGYGHAGLFWFHVH